VPVRFDLKREKKALDHLDKRITRSHLSDWNEFRSGKAKLSQEFLDFCCFARMGETEIPIGVTKMPPEPRGNGATTQGDVRLGCSSAVIMIWE
jgi:hypothetical protein